MKIKRLIDWIRANWKRWILQFGFWIFTLWRDDLATTLLKRLEVSIGIEITDYFYNIPVFAFSLFAVSVLAIVLHQKIDWINKRLSQTVSVLLGLLLTFTVFTAFSSLGSEPNGLSNNNTEPTATADWQPAINLVQSYYEFLNSAENVYEFEAAWNLLTKDFQCSETMQLNCDINNFIQFWIGIEGERSGVRVKYELRVCDSRMIDVHLIYYNRSDKDYSDPTGAEDWLHLVLDEEGDVLKIDESHPINGSSCPVAVDFE